jgi:hypothetical protein
MKEIASMIVVAAATLLLIAAAIFAGGDRSLLVPVPEAVAEDFTREIVTRRFDLAMKYLTTDRQRSESAQTIAGRFDPLFAATGKVNQVEAEPRWVQKDQASAAATVRGDRGAVSFDVSLVRGKDGLWKIDGLPDLH